MLKQKSFFARIFSSLLIFSISAGTIPAYALRPETDRSGLEEKLSPAGQEEPVIETIDLRDYEIGVYGTQNVIYYKPDDPLVIRVFRDERVHNSDVLEYLRILRELSSSIRVEEPFEIQIPQMELVRIQGYPADQSFALRTPWIEGMTFGNFGSSFLGPGEHWWSGWIGTQNPQRLILNELKRVAAKHLEWVDLKTNGLADLHTVFDSTLDNFVLPEQFIQANQTFLGGTSVHFREGELAHLHLVHIDPLDMDRLLSLSGQEEKFEDDPENVAVKRVSHELQELPVEQWGFPGAGETAVPLLRFYASITRDNSQPQPISVTVKNTGSVLYHRAVSRLKFGRRPADGNAFVLTGRLHRADPSIFTRFWLNAETGEITYKVFRSGLEEKLPEPELLSPQEGTGFLYAGDGHWFNSIQLAKPDDSVRLMLETLRQKIPPSSDPSAEVLVIGLTMWSVPLAIAGRVKELVGIDPGPKLTQLARENAQRNGFSNVRIIPADYLDMSVVAGRRFDWVVVLPPAIPVSDPMRSFFRESLGADLAKIVLRSSDGGPDGRKYLDPLIKLAPTLLKPNGKMLLFQPDFTGLQRTEEKGREAGFEVKVLRQAEVAHRRFQGRSNWLVSFPDYLQQAHGVPITRHPDGRVAFQAAALELTPALSGQEENPPDRSTEEQLRRQTTDSVVERKRRSRESNSARIGTEQVLSRIEKQEKEAAEKPKPPPPSPARLFPDFVFNKKQWVQVVGDNAGTLFERGILQIPMGKGEMILLLRGGRAGVNPPFNMMIDLLVRPDSTQPRHVYLGRIDLQFSLYGYWAATAANLSGNTAFLSQAAGYLSANGIEPSGRLSFFELSRADSQEPNKGFKALYVDHDAAWNLGIKAEDAQDALALAAVEAAIYRDHSRKVFGADLRFVENSYFAALGVKPVQTDFQKEVDWYPLEQLRWVLLDRLLERKFRVDGQDWMTRVEKEAKNLLNGRKAEISVEGGKAILLMRVWAGHIAVDLLFARGQETPRFAGRMDLESESLLYTAGVSAPANEPFSRAIAQYLAEMGVETGPASPLVQSRTTAASALWLDENLLKEFRLEKGFVRDMLIFSVIEMFRRAGVAQWAVVPNRANENLVYGRFNAQDQRGDDNVLKFDVEGTLGTLRKALIRPSLRVNPAEFSDQLLQHGWILPQDGFLDIPVQGGEVLLFFRQEEPQRHFFSFDMMLRMNYGGEHLHLAGADLVYDPDMKLYVLKGPVSRLPFSDRAVDYLKAHPKITQDQPGPFEAFRSHPNNKNALYLNPALWEYNLLPDTIQYSLLLAVLDVLHSRGQEYVGVNTAYENTKLLVPGLDGTSNRISGGGSRVVVYKLAAMENWLARQLKKPSAGAEEQVAEELRAVQEQLLDFLGTQYEEQLVFGPGRWVPDESDNWKSLRKIKVGASENYLEVRIGIDHDTLRMRLIPVIPNRQRVTWESPDGHVLQAEMDRLLEEFFEGRLSEKPAHAGSWLSVPVRPGDDAVEYTWTPAGQEEQPVEFIAGNLDEEHPIILTPEPPDGTDWKWEGDILLGKTKIGDFRLERSGDLLKLDHIEVHAAKKGIGIGSTVVEALFRHAIRQGIQRFESEVSNPRLMRIFWRNRRFFANAIATDYGEHSEKREPLLFREFLKKYHSFASDKWPESFKSIHWVLEASFIPPKEFSLPLEWEQMGEAGRVASWIVHELYEESGRSEHLEQLITESSHASPVRFELGDPPFDYLEMVFEMVDGVLQLTLRLHQNAPQFIHGQAFREGITHLLAQAEKNPLWKGGWSPSLPHNPYSGSDVQVYHWVPVQKQDIETVHLHVQQAMEKLFAYSNRGPSRWQVIGPGMLERFPFLAALSQQTNLFLIDPGTEGTSALVEAIIRQRDIAEPGRVDYYGSPEEIRNFALYAESRGISFRPNPDLPDNPKPTQILTQILLNIADLSPTQVTKWNVRHVAGVSMERLKNDLEILAQS